MASRTRKILHDDGTRAKIQAAAIITRFQKCIDGKIILDAQQVSCGKALLNKVLPDLSATTLTGTITIDPIQSLLERLDGTARSIPARK